MERNSIIMMSNPLTHMFQAAAAASAILVGGTITDTDLDWASAIERLGIAVVLLVFFVGTSWIREKRMAKRIDQLEKQVVSVSNKLAALTENTTQLIKEENALMQQAIQSLSTRPCFAFENREEFDAWLNWKHARNGNH
jgi:hypothetical protein